MAALRSNQNAQKYLRECLQGIPISWWSDFDGQSVAKILRELEINTSVRAVSAQRLYKRVQNRLTLSRATSPTRMQFLALCLHQGLTWTGDKFLNKIREKSLAHIVVWHQTDPDPPAPNDPIESWRAWLSVIHKSLRPSSEALAGMSRAQQAFRDAVLRVEVTEVTQNCILWSIPVDIERASQVLKQHFENVVRRFASTTPQPACGGADPSEKSGSSLESPRTCRIQDPQNTTSNKGPTQNSSHRHQDLALDVHSASPSSVQTQLHDPTTPNQTQQGLPVPPATQQQSSVSRHAVLPEVFHEDSGVPLTGHINRHQGPVRSLLSPLPILADTVAPGINLGSPEVPSQLQVTQRATEIHVLETLKSTQAIAQDFATFFEDLRCRDRKNTCELQALDCHLDNLKGYIIQSVGFQIEIRNEQERFKGHPIIVDEFERVRLDGLRLAEDSVREQAELEVRRKQLVETSICNGLAMQRARDAYDGWIRSLIEEGVIRG